MDLSTEEDAKPSESLNTSVGDDYDDLYIPPVEKPKYSALEIILRILIPPILLWDLLKITMRALFAKAIGRTVLESQSYTIEDSAKDTAIQLTKLSESDTHKNVDHNRQLIETHDGATLDTMSFTYKKKLFGKKHSGIYIIHCPANAETYEPEIMNLAKLAEDTRGTVIGFNYRGVGNSQKQPTAFRDLENDAIAITQDLIDNGVDPENIYAHGFSIGGIIASTVNAQLRSIDDMDKSLYVYPDRTPSSLTKVAVGFIRRSAQMPKGAMFNKKRHYELLQDLDGYTETRFWKFMGALLYPLVKFVLYTTQWGADAKDIFETPIDHRETATVKSSSACRLKSKPDDDPIVSDYASVSRLLKSERQNIKHGDLTELYDHVLNEEEIENIRDAHDILRKARKFSAHDDGHWQNSKDLNSKDFVHNDEHFSVTAYQHFINFIRATHPEGFKKDKLSDAEQVLVDAWQTAGY